MCAVVSGASTTAGAVVIQWTCGGSTNQRWTINPLEAATC
ncbi:RICIN domain-containing protein [Streptomyces sp. NPDC056747]